MESDTESLFDGWYPKTVADGFRITNGVTYASADYSSEDRGNIFLTIKCFTKGGGFNPEGIKYFRGFFLPEQQVKTGELIIAKTDLTRAGDIIGSPMLVPGFSTDGKMLPSMDLCVLRPFNEDVDLRFLFYRLMLSDARCFMRAHSAGSTVLHLESSALPRFGFRAPKADKQRRIATILARVDDLIAKTGAVIEKLRQVRAGLLHDLLTRGLDARGQLRDPIAHPEQFQDSPLGRIPREWAVQQLHELVLPNRRITYGIVQPGEFDPNGILLIRGQDYISEWALRESFFKVAPSRHESYRRSLTRAGDLLVCIVGATTGAVAQVPDWIDESNITQTTARVACDPNKLVSRFALHVLRSELGQHQVRRYVKGSAQPGLNLRDVEVFWTPVPSVDEQNTIARILDMHAEDITATENELAKLYQLKSGLMTDLLTGRVRVPATLETGKVHA